MCTSWEKKITIGAVDFNEPRYSQQFRQTILSEIMFFFCAGTLEIDTTKMKLSQLSSMTTPIQYVCFGNSLIGLIFTQSSE